MEIIRVGIISIVGVLLALQLKNQKTEYGIYMGIVVGLILISMGIDSLVEIVNHMKLLNTYLGQHGNYISILLKVVGITYLCEYSGAICKDAGFHTIAGQVEMLGKLFVLVSGIPILIAVIEQMEKFMR